MCVCIYIYIYIYINYETNLLKRKVLYIYYIYILYIYIIYMYNIYIYRGGSRIYKKGGSKIMYEAPEERNEGRRTLVWEGVPPFQSNPKYLKLCNLGHP